MNAVLSLLPHLSTALIRRLRYRHGFPFVTSVPLAAVVTAVLPRFGGPTSIWTFALLAFIATTFAMFCGGRFRTAYVAIAVAPPFLVTLQWFLRMRSWMPDFPTKPVTEFFFYFVAAPILVVWLAATLLGRKERHA